MSEYEYIVKIGFWLHASDGLSIEAASDAEAIAKAKLAAMRAMEDCAIPAHVEYDGRRQGMISWIDRVTPEGTVSVAEDIAFDDDRIFSPPIG